MANKYISQFSGDELDFAISSALGDKYRGNLSPGCHTIGASTSMQVDFDALTIPGKYTAYFYINGPAALVGVSPVCIQVFWGSTMLYQTIQVGARLFWRDLLSGNTKWKEVNLGVEATTIIDNLETDLSVDEGASIKALSANMGAELRKRMENLQIGNTNLMDFSNVFDEYSHSVADRWSYNNTSSVTNVNLKDFINLTAYKGRFPMVDDVDRENVTIFRSVGNGAFGFRTDESNRNPVQMAKEATYTASVYILCESNYFNADESCKFNSDNSPTAYIKIVKGSEALATTEISLYDLFEKESETRVYVPEDTVNGKDAYIQIIKTASIGKTNGYMRLVVNYTSTVTGDALGVQFGINDPNGVASSIVSEFVYPKIEYGQYATQYNHSWQDLYYFFNNCEEIYGRPVIVNKSAGSYDNWITEQSSPVFNYDNKTFNVEPVAVGGGGGFITSTPDEANTNTRKNKIIIFDKGYSTVDDPNYRIRGLKAIVDGAWTTLCNSPMTVATASNGFPTKVIQADCGWLNKSEESDSSPAVLCYWDADRMIWRPVGAVATQVWFKQLEVPTDPSKRKLIWIKSDTRAPYIYDEELSKWVPLLALWGSPNT